MADPKDFWTDRTYLVGVIAPFFTVSELIGGHRLLGVAFAFLWPASWIAIAARHGMESRGLKWVENACFAAAFLLMVWYEVLWWQAYLYQKPWP